MTAPTRLGALQRAPDRRMFDNAFSFAIIMNQTSKREWRDKSAGATILPAQAEQGAHPGRSAAVARPWNDAANEATQLVRADRRPCPP